MRATIDGADDGRGDDEAEDGLGGDEHDEDFLRDDDLQDEDDEFYGDEYGDILLDQSPSALLDRQLYNFVIIFNYYFQLI
jgi:hypothetical protein